MQRFEARKAAAARAAQRRERENGAPRLADEVPDLLSLRLVIDEVSEIGAVSPKYVRRIVVATAPALFLIHCGDSKCADGGHDVTGFVMQGLRSRSSSFHGAFDCRGSIGTGPCTRVMHVDAVAEYGARGASTRPVVAPAEPRV